MPKLSLSSTAPDKVRADALIVGLVTAAEPDGVPRSATPGLDAVATAAAGIGATGKAGQVVTIPAPDGFAVSRVVTVGLGAEEHIDAEAVRRAAGSASRAVTGLGRAHSLLGLLDLSAAAEGHALGAYVFTTYKEPGDPPIGNMTLAVPRADKAMRTVLDRARITAGAVARARDFVNTAPNELSPEIFASRAADAARAAGLTVQVMTEKSLERGGYGGILGVGSGSTRPPRLLRITHTPKGATKNAPTVALVGKGVTFDSGGLSLKPAAGMDKMTSDMAGAAAVIATMIAVAESELPLAVTATVPMVENLPSGSSYRPGDVLTMRGGKTVLVLNTDAEGRLILADAIVRACEDEPDYLLETSTLTGAQMVALGAGTMGVMGSEKLRDRVAELGREAGEDAWAMPLPPALRKGLDSPLADLANVSDNRWGGMLVAGHFLASFVADGVTWAHLDVAGPSFHSGRPHGYTVAGGTGVPVRTLLATLEELANGADLHDA